MRSSWIRVDPDSSDKCPLKRIYRHREGEKTHTDDDDVKMKQVLENEASSQGTLGAKTWKK